MSIYYRSIEKPLPFQQVLGSLPQLGLLEYPARDTDKTWRCLTDGKDYLWIGTGDGSDTGFDQFNINCVNDMLASFAEHFRTSFVNDRELGSEFADEPTARRLGYLRVPAAIVPPYSSSADDPGTVAGPMDPIPTARRTDGLYTNDVPMAELWKRCKRFFYHRKDGRRFALKAFQAYRCLVETHWGRFSEAGIVGALRIGKFCTSDDESFVRFNDEDDHVIVTATARNVFGSLIFLEECVVRYVGAERPPIPVTVYDRQYKKRIQSAFKANGWPIKL